MVFIDLEKAYDKVPREVMWWTLEKKQIACTYIEVTTDMCDGALMNWRIIEGDIMLFPITIDLHHSSMLSPYLFLLVMDEITRHVRDVVLWSMLFADDIVFN